MSSESKATPPPTNRGMGDTLFTFLVLYFTTLFSLDTWNAARGSAHRAPSSNSYFRPANLPPAPDSYQGSMSRFRGNGDGRRDVGRVQGDSRPPLRMGTGSSCGACSM
ncbi:hypothetical protein K491DRAFT_712782 [Lophiostoma macrostomum CBS 122681]|uniref:Uncharacterized protein n=1 Tax=Lophiostoma macrostomum CBS 122681 TaxID=1314788 RepID=A0A6A6TH73_9PLEO|nr:hypothetical protein K491DRAFT_712782 [Lophiostoma macrostomum CBS 122681]